MIRELDDPNHDAGVHFLAWDGTDSDHDRLANGVYVYRVVAQASGRTLEKTGQRLPGPPGFLIDEIKLQGIVRTKQQGLVAMINGPDNKGYLIRVGDKVLDGEVVRITPSSVVFRQEVNDPTRIERFREVVKDLTPEAQRK